jgi:hypothetical protein
VTSKDEEGSKDHHLHLPVLKFSLLSGKVLKDGRPGGRILTVYHQFVLGFELAWRLGKSSGSSKQAQDDKAKANLIILEVDRINIML